MAEDLNIRPHWGPRESEAQLRGFGDVQSEAPVPLAESELASYFCRWRQPWRPFPGRDPSPRCQPARPALRRSERSAPMLKQDLTRARASVSYASCRLCDQEVAPGLL